jgi:bis(5'-nucleosyl)-tetraphosphatase (symmetrical)
MSTYIIGDVQGCFDDLMLLLKKIRFDVNKDTLIFCGDLVNRGGQSLQVLRWIYAHQKCCRVTLGNHDLSLLAQYYLVHLRKASNLEFKTIFASNECEQLMTWLGKQNILIHLKEFTATVVHAGIYPSWSLKRAKKEAKRLEKIIKNKPKMFFKNMFGSKPNHWNKDLKSWDRARFVVNSFTRMRFLFKNGGLNFKAKGEINTFPQIIPWFNYKPYRKKHSKIIFGHWSAIGLYRNDRVLCLDTGKVWGGKLSALHIDTDEIIQI